MPEVPGRSATRSPPGRRWFTPSVDHPRRGSTHLVHWQLGEGHRPIRRDQRIVVGKLARDAVQHRRNGLRIARHRTPPSFQRRSASLSRRFAAPHRRSDASTARILPPLRGAHVARANKASAVGRLTKPVPVEVARRAKRVPELRVRRLAGRRTWSVNSPPSRGSAAPAANTRRSKSGAPGTGISRKPV